MFASVDEDPIATASLRQGHRVKLLSGGASDAGFSDILVKVQRPRISEVVDVDPAALRKVAGWLRHIRLVSSLFDATVLLEEFGRTSLQEIDYRNEPVNAERFAAECAADARVAVRRLVWGWNTRRMLTLDDATDVKVMDSDGLRAAGIDPVAVAPVFACVMFDQLFSNGFFHADPHPGNILLSHGTPVPRPGS